MPMNENGKFAAVIDVVESTLDDQALQPQCV